MARRNELRADAVGIVKKLAELDPIVALHARVGRAACRIFGDEVINDLAELGLKVERIERDAELVGDAPRILGIGGRAAALFVMKRGARSEERGVRTRCNSSSALLAPCSVLHASR